MDKEQRERPDQKEDDQARQQKPIKSFKELLGVRWPEKKYPHIGMRAVKTSLTMALILILYRFLQRADVLLAMSAGVIALQATIEESIRSGIVRLIGTGLGGILATMMIVLITISPLQTHERIAREIGVCIGVLMLIGLCVSFDVKDAIVICLVVFFVVMLDDRMDSVQTAVHYAFSRMLDTAIGIVIAVVVNISIRPPKTKK